jgi:hypothetical protein
MRWFWLLAFAGLLLGFPGPSKAITIYDVSIGTNAGNTADQITDAANHYSQNRSSTEVLDTGGSAGDTVGSTVTASTRYAAMTGADGGNTANQPISLATHDYSITFTVSAPEDVVYDVVIDALRIGALTRVIDGNAGGYALLSEVTGYLDGAENANLFLGAVSLAQGTDDVDVPFAQSSTTLLISDLIGTHTFTLDFVWSSEAGSVCVGQCGGPNRNAAEMAVRLGMAGTATVNDVTATDYPGVGSRDIGGDGHIVNIQALVTSSASPPAVPEPGTLGLLGTGLLGLALLGRRPRA